MEKLLDAKSLMELLGIHETTLARWIKNGTIPEPLNFGKGRKRRWNASVLERWLQEQQERDVSSTTPSTRLSKKEFEKRQELASAALQRHTIER